MSTDTYSPLLLAPGPVQLHPEVQKILSLKMIHHRTPEFDEIFKSVLEKLKKLFQTTQPVFIISSTGSGGMEALLINVLTPKAKVLALVSGKFGERWADMAEAYGAAVHRLQIPWGESVNPDLVKTYLDENPDTDIVMTQACETSTATVHPICELSKIVANTKALFLVDAITALGAMPLPMDEWKIDGLVAGSQKAIMLPTGLSLIAFSKKAWDVINKNKTPRFYFDILKEFAANQKGESFFSSNVPLIRALKFVLDDIFKTTPELDLEKLFATLKRRANYTKHMALICGLKIYSKSPSDSVTALILPNTSSDTLIDGVKFRDHLEKKYALTVMGGQDQLKGKIIRLGHMGYITDYNLHEATMRLALALIDFGLQLNLDTIKKESLQWLNDNPCPDSRYKIESQIEWKT